MSRSSDGKAQRHRLLALWCLMLLASVSSVRALPAAQGIWENHTPVSRRLLAKNAPAPVKAKPPQVATWEAAPSCRAMPHANDSTPDTEGRLWGWNNNTRTPCAYKDPQNSVLFYVDYAPGSWLHTPACTSAPFSDDSVADSHFKVWGWEDGRLCAYKDDQQRPTPITKANNKLAWADAPACTQEPQPTIKNAVPDRLGCLWGWQLDRNCAFKNETTSLPKYIPSYNVMCTASLTPSNKTSVDVIGGGNGSGPTGSAVGSVDITEDDKNWKVGAITAVSAGHREQQPYYTPEEVEQMFNRTPSNVTVHDISKNCADSSGKDQDKSDYAFATTTSVDDIHMGHGSYPGDANAPWSITTQDTGSGRHLLEKQETKDEDKTQVDMKAARKAAMPDDCEYGGMNGFEAWHASATYDSGIGGMTLPRPRGLARGVISVQWLDTARNNFFAAEQTISQQQQQPQLKAKMDEELITAAGLPSSRGTVLPQQQRRHLLASASATATSTGGQAVSQAMSAGKDAVTSSHAKSSGTGAALSVGITNGTSAVANSSAVATGNQTAVSVVQAKTHNNRSRCIVAGSAVNNVTVLTGCSELPLVPEGDTNASAPALNGLALSWHKVPACSALPTKQTAVADTMNRLWGYEKNASCAFRAVNGNSLSYAGYVPLDWQTSPACVEKLNTTNSMSDADGRLWGWTAGKNCAFKDAYGLPVYYPEYFTAPWRAVKESGDRAGHQLLPSAAGKAGDGTNGIRALRRHMLTPVRKLLATASAVAVSSGGHSVSRSTATGKDSVSSSQAISSGNGMAVSVGLANGASTVANSSATATGNQTAVSVVQASRRNNSNKCIVSGTAVNNVTVLTGCDEPPLLPEGSTNASAPALNGLATSWQSAPPCKAPPTKQTAVADTLNRLWGYEKNTSCAFRAANGESLGYAGYKPLDWETANACDQMPNATNSMSDADGRLWGWTSGDNCAFKDAYGLPVYYPEYFTSPPRALKESGNSVGDLLLKPTGPVLQPSAAAQGKLASAPHRPTTAFEAAERRNFNDVTVSRVSDAGPEQKAMDMLNNIFDDYLNKS